MSDGDQEVGRTIYTVPEQIKEGAFVAIFTGEALNRGVGKVIVDEVTERLPKNPQEALGALVRGEIALTSGAIGKSIEQNVQGIEKEEKIEQIRNEVTQFANGLVVFQRISSEVRKSVIEAVIRGAQSPPADLPISDEEYSAAKAFIDKSISYLSNTYFVKALADSQRKSPEEMAKEIVIANFSEGYVLQKIGTSLTDALTKKVNYSELRRLEEEREMLQSEIDSYKKEERQLKTNIDEVNLIAAERKLTLITKEGNIDREKINDLVNQLATEIQTARRDLASLRKNVNASSDQIETKRGEIENLERQRELVLNYEANVRRYLELTRDESIRREIEDKKDRLSKIEGDLVRVREQVKREREEYIERVYRSSVIGLGEYAQEVNDAIARVNLSEEEKVIRRSILDKVREELKDKGKRKDVLDILFDLNEPFESRMKKVFEELGVKAGTLPIPNLRKIYREMMRNEEFKKSLYHDVATEALAYAVLRDPKALRGRLSKDEAAALAFSDGVLLELINSAQQRVEKAQEKLSELEEMGLIKKGFRERVGKTLKALGKGIKEHKFLTAGAMIAIILFLIYVGVLPPLAKWPGEALSAAGGLGKEIIGY